jgi:hypothetical protein
MQTGIGIFSKNSVIFFWNAIVLGLVAQLYDDHYNPLGSTFTISSNAVKYGTIINFYSWEDGSFLLVYIPYIFFAADQVQITQYF